MRADCPLPPGSRIWLYCRHSPGDEQDIASQAHATESYCDEHGLVIAHSFLDVAKPGSTVADRDEFLAMMRAAHQEPRPVDGIVFWSFSRLSRDYDDAQFYKADLRRRGYTLISVTEPIPEGPAGRMVEAAIDFASMLYLNQMTHSIKRGLHDLARQGYSVGGHPPVGYLAERVHLGYKSGGKPKYGTKWVPDPTLFPLAQKAWEMRANGATYPEIHAACPGLYKDSRCLSWFFDNKTYLGVRKCGDIEVPDAHPAACTQQQWDIVQAMRKRPHGGAYPRRVSSPYLLSGLLVCAYCYGPVSGSSAGGGWRYYICSRKPNIGWSSCEARSIGANKLDQAVIRTILDHVLTEERFYELVEAVNQRLAADQNGLGLELASKERELIGANQRINNLLYAVAGGSLAATDHLLVEEKRRAQLQAELALLQQRAAMQRIVVDDSIVAAKLQQMREDLCNLSPESVKPLRRFLASFVDHIVVSKERGELHYRLPMILPRSEASRVKELFPIARVGFSYETARASRC